MRSSSSLFPTATMLVTSSAWREGGREGGREGWLKYWTKVGGILLKTSSRGAGHRFPQKSLKPGGGEGGRGKGVVN